MIQKGLGMDLEGEGRLEREFQMEFGRSLNGI